MNQPLAISATGSFCGYASVFGMVDQSGDIVMPGAFARSLHQKGGAGIRLLFQHDPKEPVGTWQRIVEDGHGLWVQGHLEAGVERSDALRRLIGSGAVDGLSIGFRTVKATRERPANRRRLWQIDLWEISIVTFPMMDGARIQSAARLPDPSVRLKQSLSAAISLLRNS